MVAHSLRYCFIPYALRLLYTQYAFISTMSQNVGEELIYSTIHSIDSNYTVEHTHA